MASPPTLPLALRRSLGTTPSTGTITLPSISPAEKRRSSRKSPHAAERTTPTAMDAASPIITTVLLGALEGPLGL